MKQCRYPSKHLLTTSVFPSDWGWYEELWANWVPKHENKSFQKWLVKIGSRSLTMTLGLPCSFWIFSKKTFSTILAVKGCDNAMRCAYYVRRSTTTMMTLWPLDMGSPMMKSMDTSSHCCLGIDNGCKRPSFLTISPLFLWQTKHSSTKFWTSPFSPSQKNLAWSMICL